MAALRSFAVNQLRAAGLCTALVLMDSLDALEEALWAVESGPVLAYETMDHALEQVSPQNFHRRV
jgi:hypothetical protein